MKSNSCFNFNAGRLVLNFLNTVDERPGYDSDSPSAPTELLCSPEILLSWFDTAGVFSLGWIDQVRAQCLGNTRSAESLLLEVVSLRERLFPILLKLARGVGLSGLDLSTLNEDFSRLPPRKLIRRNGSLVVDWDEAPSCNPGMFVAPIIQDAVDLLTSPAARKVKVCAAADCGWLFLDTSKSGKRRWCDMADCGNREKQRRFRGVVNTQQTQPH